MILNKPRNANIPVLFPKTARPSPEHQLQRPHHHGVSDGDAVPSGRAPGGTPAAGVGVGAERAVPGARGVFRRHVRLQGAAADLQRLEGSGARRQGRSRRRARRRRRQGARAPLRLGPRGYRPLFRREPEAHAR